MKRFTAHLHSESGRYYVYDRMNWRPYVAGYETEAAAWSCALSLEQEWKAECVKRQRQEMVSVS